MTLPVAILAGGLATRMRPVTRRLPKSLIDVGGQPFAVRQVELLREHDVTDITFLVGHLGEMVAEALGDGSRWGVRLHYAFDGPSPLGTGGAVRRALPGLGDPFLLLYGDSYLECDYAAVAGALAAGGTEGLMTVYRNDGRLDRSNVLYDSGRILAYDKAQPTPAMRHIDYGLGAFRHSAFAAAAGDAAFDLVSVYQALLARDSLAGFEATHRFYEIGSIAGLEETRAHLATKASSLP
uniref:Putative nucleotidyl transferase n=1 Tax=uncultured Acidobacteriota bacterium TaxID=171953 RepID=Q7X336_9BACT|nr:putative nucleotidyl transferase [uncultured Acidobacteriota bacterium]